MLRSHDARVRTSIGEIRTSDIATFYRDGHSRTETARHFGVSTGCVQKRLNAYDPTIWRAKGAGRLRALNGGATRADVVAAFQAGMSASLCAQRFGLSKSGVLHHVRRAGAVTRGVQTRKTATRCLRRTSAQTYARQYALGATLQQIADAHGVSSESVRKSLISIKARRRPTGVVRGWRDTLTPKLSQKQTEAFTQLVAGLLLGDGCIPIGTAHLTLSQSPIRSGWVHDVEARLTRLGVSYATPLVRRPPRRLGGRDTETLQLRTKSYEFLRTQRRRWYPKNKKRIPRNLVLTPQVIADWLSGDGCRARLRDGCMHFCTNGFLLTDVQFLCDQLLCKFGVQTWPMKAKKELCSGRQQYTIYVPRRSALKLKRLCAHLMPPCTRSKFDNAKELAGTKTRHR